jgi:hypothetical protein
MTVKDMKRNLTGYRGGNIGRILKVDLSTQDMGEILENARALTKKLIRLLQRWSKQQRLLSKIIQVQNRPHEMQRLNTSSKVQSIVQHGLPSVRHPLPARC